MFTRSFAAILCVVAMSAPASYAASDPGVAAPAAALSADLTSDAGAGSGMMQAASGTGSGQPTFVVKPFSTAAIQVKVGLAGIGLDLAVPVAGRLNLRVGGNYFSYNPNLVVNGINVLGNIQLRSASANVDVFPFGNAFRISPGVVVYNGNNIAALASVPAGQTFTLNGVSYTSSATAPVTGNFGLSFGNKIAPSLTMGFGNMIPRKGGHWSMPLEIGGEFIGTAPAISITLAGTACQTGSIPPVCSSIATDPTVQKNLAAELVTLNGDIPSQLKFFPIVSLGLSYKFGKGGGR